ncbi:MAG: glycerophosphoryl diester phosphodiesterase membrane domain-containing protein [Firmicutes bacterium]|nr:glycerophosphoryl diester phosphodiesterase membrane domain-containing protein [Bacillota bacterium]
MPQKLKPYWQALPVIFNYQIITKALLGIWIYLLGRITQALLVSTGRVAITSGDFGFLFKTWQGYLILLVGLVSLFIYIAFDLNTKIVLSRKLVTGEEISIWKSMDEGFWSIKALLCPRGVIVALYIALIAPLLGFGVSVSLTEGLYVPTFIASVIADTPLYLILTSFAVLVFLSIGVANLFILHGIVIDKMSVKEASEQSGKLIHENWQDYLKQTMLFLIVIVAAIGIVAAVSIVLPQAIIAILPLPAGASRFLTIILILLGCTISMLASLCTTPFYLMKMTQLFYSYKKGEPQPYAEWETRKHPVALSAAAVAFILIIIGSFMMDRNFDQLFPLETKTQIVAHRGGGNEGAENTVAGIETAYAVGAYGSEIDIQRTKDGTYVLVHDGNFERVAGDNREPEDMTLEEIRTLSVDGQPVPTFEEALAASKGKIVLFTELKGDTADKQMADDAVRIIKENNMEAECVLVSLKYDLIDYIETKYPDIQTGFLLFASFGAIDKLHCDYLGVEEESATENAISAAHDQGKKLLVWTPNEKETQKHFLCSNADGLITDNVNQAVEIQKELTERSDLQRMVDCIMTLVS